MKTFSIIFLFKALKLLFFKFINFQDLNFINYFNSQDLTHEVYFNFFFMLFYDLKIKSQFIFSNILSSSCLVGLQ